ncbi:MAG: YceI family protein [Saprospiraceae bacterium]|nr:YceI family protein [Saprospiraceae bacterium]MCB0624214.1 YceI family protein [Saprospiraceae bacterium]MCB0678268.1 YceI family protein [Saprospiraceae bacterium]MCB0680962.1 YceI family protein [Saprospiraceae bacterium]
MGAFVLTFAVIGLAFTNPGEVASYNVDAAASQIVWKGYKVLGEHTGTINVQKGSLNIQDGQLVGGSFAIDMTSIACTDLSGEYKGKLEGHLKSDDFFGAATYPTATFVITSATPNGVDRYKVTGNLTIKDITKEIKFIANLEKEEGQVVAKADIQIDRSEFNVRYGSGSFFDSLGDKTIYDEFDLSVSIVATGN